MEHVNHPKHYNSHPNGIECIDIIRHYVCDIANAIKYLWRAGMKPEMGMEDAEKEIEDLKKALWYIEDYAESTRRNSVSENTPELIDSYFVEMTDHTMLEVTTGYCDEISQAILILLRTGIVINNVVYNVYGWYRMLYYCQKRIQQRIADLEH